MNYVVEELDAQVSQIPPTVINELMRIVCLHLDKCGLYYRIFARNKSSLSLARKLNTQKYIDGKKIQDLLGVRIALYFKDDIEISRQIINDNFDILDISQDKEKEDEFKPMRLNFVCKIPDDIRKHLPEILMDTYPIDSSFEIQIRTIFSEGWHEVEHDLRYKCKPDWEDQMDLSRALNGIFATLETCDWSILNVFEELSYRKYKQKEWGAMFRNKLRIHFKDEKIKDEIITIFQRNNELPKQFLRIDRSVFLTLLASKEVSNFPKTLNNIIFVLNELYIQKKEISSLAPQQLLAKISKFKH